MKFLGVLYSILQYSSIFVNKTYDAHIYPDPVFVNVLRAQESIPSNRFRQVGNRFLMLFKRFTNTGSESKIEDGACFDRDTTSSKE
jgi:hypothetical protein